jgi:hypothetical protein
VRGELRDKMRSALSTELGLRRTDNPSDVKRNRNLIEQLLDNKGTFRYKVRRPRLPFLPSLTTCVAGHHGAYEVRQDEHTCLCYGRHLLPWRSSCTCQPIPSALQRDQCPDFGTSFNNSKQRFRMFVVHVIIPLLV